MLCCICNQDLSHLPLPQAEAHVDACCDAKENVVNQPRLAHTTKAKAKAKADHAVHAVPTSVAHWLQVRANASTTCPRNPQGLGLPHYAAAFASQHIDLDVLPCLNTADLDELGVQAPEHQQTILAAAATLSTTPLRCIPPQQPGQGQSPAVICLDTQPKAPIHARASEVALLQQLYPVHGVLACAPLAMRMTLHSAGQAAGTANTAPGAFTGAQRCQPCQACAPLCKPVAHGQHRASGGADLGRHCLCQGAPGSGACSGRAHGGPCGCSAAAAGLAGGAGCGAGDGARLGAIG